MMEEEYITNTQAAELLCVSDQYFIKLLESGELNITYREVGGCRRLKAEEVLKFKQEKKGRVP